MSHSLVTLQPTKFQNLDSNFQEVNTENDGITYGYRIYDDSNSEYCNLYQSIEELQDAMQLTHLYEFIKENIKRKVVIVGDSTGTDAHTVGIDAIMNMKGFAGHYGLERYEMIEAYNLGSQVPNEEFIKKSIELKADILLVSQTVTQKNIHIQNLTELVELLEAEGLRDKIILVAGGPRITHELAKELGYDAGFGPGKYADDVATFAATEMVNRGLV